MFKFIGSTLKFLVAAFLLFVFLGVLIGMFLVNQVSHAINPNTPDIFSDCKDIAGRDLDSAIATEKLKIDELNGKGLTTTAQNEKEKLDCLIAERTKSDASMTTGQPPALMSNTNATTVSSSAGRSSQPFAVTPSNEIQTSQKPVQCSEGIALNCLPKSSGSVSFVDPAAANLAAAANIHNGLSTSEATADAIEDGAAGKAARLCGIAGSNDSSPLAKHLAAVRLKNLRPDDGQASDPCLKFAEHFL